ncbi:MAG: S1C family serine protease [Pyrinomonadaceae bacterium]
MKTLVLLGISIGLSLTFPLDVMSQKRGQPMKSPQTKVLTAEEIAKRFLPSVVLIVCDNGKGRVSQGSGFFVGKGVILTNFHVVEKMRRGKLKIAVGGTNAQEWWIKSILATDSRNDLALLAFEESKSNASSVLKLTESDSPIIGQKIYVLSNPKGLTGTISQGIVSGEIRNINGIALLQIDAPISSGSSGGAVLNAQGEVIGIATGSLSTGQNLNFAVPTKSIRPFMISSVYLTNGDAKNLSSPTIENGWSSVPGSTSSIAENKIADPSPSSAGKELSYAEITSSIRSSLQNRIITAKGRRVQIKKIDFSDCTLDFSYDISHEADNFTRTFQADLSNLKAVVGTVNEVGIGFVTLVFESQLAKTEYESDGSSTSTLTNEVGIPVPAEMKQYELLFNGLKPVCSFSAKPNRPSFTETADWLIRMIEGTEQTYDRITIKTDRLRFAECAMTRIEAVRGSGVVAFLTYRPSLKNLRRVELDKNTSGNWGVWLVFNENFVIDRENSLGREQIRKDQMFFLLPNYENAKRVSSAFTRILELCGEMKKQPF